MKTTRPINEQLSSYECVPLTLSKTYTASYHPNYWCFYGIVTTDRLQGVMHESAFKANIIVQYTEELLSNKNLELSIHTLLYGDSKPLEDYGVENCYSSNSSIFGEHYGFAYITTQSVYGFTKDKEKTILSKIARLFYYCCNRCVKSRVKNARDVFFDLRSRYFAFMALNVYHYVRYIPPLRDDPEQNAGYQDLFKIAKSTSDMLDTDSIQFGCPHQEDGSPVESFMDRGICLHHENFEVNVVNESKKVQLKIKKGVLKDGFSLMVQDLIRFELVKDKITVVKKVVEKLKKATCTCASIISFNESAGYYRIYCFYNHYAKFCQNYYMPDDKKFEHSCALSDIIKGKNASFTEHKPERLTGQYCVVSHSEIQMVNSFNLNDIDRQIHSLKSISDIIRGFEESTKYILHILYDIHHRSLILLTIDGEVVCPYDTMMCTKVSYTYTCQEDYCNILLDDKFEYNALNDTVEAGANGNFKSFTCKTIGPIGNFYKELQNHKVTVYDFQQNSLVRIIPEVNALLLNHFNRERLLQKRCRFVEAIFILTQNKCANVIANENITIPSPDYLPWNLFVCNCVTNICDDNEDYLMLADKETDEFYRPACLIFDANYKENNITKLLYEKSHLAKTSFVCYVQMIVDGNSTKWEDIMKSMHFKGGVADREFLEKYHFVADSIAFNMLALANSPGSRCVSTYEGYNGRIQPNSVTCFCRQSFAEYRRSGLQSACHAFNEIVRLIREAMMIFIQANLDVIEIEKSRENDDKLLQTEDDNIKQGKSLENMMLLNNETVGNYQTSCDMTYCSCVLGMECNTSKLTQSGCGRDYSDSKYSAICHNIQRGAQYCFEYEQRAICCFVKDKNIAEFKAKYINLVEIMTNVCRKWIPKE